LGQSFSAAGAKRWRKTEKKLSTPVQIWPGPFSQIRTAPVHPQLSLEGSLGAQKSEAFLQQSGQAHSALTKQE